MSGSNDAIARSEACSDASADRVPLTLPQQRAVVAAAERVPQLEANTRVVKRIAVAILTLLVLAACYLAQEILIPIVLSLLLSLLLSPVVTLLERTRLPRAAGSLFVLLALVGLAAGSMVLLAEPARAWIASAPATIKSIQQRFEGLRAPFKEAQEASKKIESLTQSAEQTPVVTAQPSLLEGFALGTPRVLSQIAAVLLLIYFFLSSGNGFLRRLVEIAPGMSEKKMVVSIARDVQNEMSGYLLMISLINLALGTATALALAMLGVPNALLWGALATLLNFAPYVGPATTAVALALVGFATFPTPGHALAVPGTFLLLAFIEGQLVTPTLIGRKLALDPTAVFVWLLVWGWLWGIVGVLLAGPLIACLRIVCQHVEALSWLGILIGDGQHGARAAAKDAAASD